MPAAVPTPRDPSEAAVLLRRLQRAIGELQLGEAERMTYELVRFHWQSEGRRLEPGHAILSALATLDLGDALEICTELLAYYEDELRTPLVHAGAA